MIISSDKDFQIINKAIYDNRPKEEDFGRIMIEDKSINFLMRASKQALDREYKNKRYSKKVYEFKRLDLIVKLTDKFVNEYVKKIMIINNILVSEIKKYWNSQYRLANKVIPKDSYDSLMEELDELLIECIPKEIVHVCNYRTIEMGFCFHRDLNGKFINNYIY